MKKASNFKRSGKWTSKSSKSSWLFIKWVRGSLSSTLLLGIVVVILSIFSGRTSRKKVSVESSLRSMLGAACKDGVCMHGLVDAVDRTLIAGRNLQRGWKLLEIPRSMQIWTLDALRDPFVKKNLFRARHLKTMRPLSSKAFLAAHLAVLRNSPLADDPFDEAAYQRKIYLDQLPTYEDFISHHPVSFDFSDLRSKFGAHTYFYYLVSKRKEEIESEYKAFANESEEFTELVSMEDYIAARLIVQTRTFKTESMDELDASQEELELYKSHLGIDMYGGCSAIVQLLDFIDSHHEQKNVQYKYLSESKKFYLFVFKDIAVGDALIASYGDRADLYPTYGFVNGDFSERTAALLGVHPMIDRRVVSEKKYEAEQRKQLIGYLQFDDGYSTCITDEDVDAMDFKRLKKKLLLLILNDYKKWIVSLPRQENGSDPTNKIIQIDDGVNALISTCRLLGMSHHDYDGEASLILEEKIQEIEAARRVAPEDYHGESYNLVFKQGDKGLELRAAVWLYRLAAENLKRWGSTTPDEELAKINVLTPYSQDWTAAYVRYQEMQTTEYFKLYAEHLVREMRSDQNELVYPDSMFYRNQYCPYSTPKLAELLSE